MLYPATDKLANIAEIFSSLQGEGTHMGEKHLFIRFAECNIQCSYCDEVHTGSTEMSLEEVLSAVDFIESAKGPHAYVSLTGGEPLLYVPFLTPLMEALRQREHKIYLETNGILWKSLEKIIPWVDCVAMDMKSPSVTKTSNYDEDHRRFLQISTVKETMVKIVVSKDIDFAEFEKQIQIIAEIDAPVVLVLMPMSAQSGEGHQDPELMEVLSRLQELAGEWLEDVRIVPRLHKILNIQ